MDYKEAGVDVEAGRAFVEKIRDSVERTFRPETLGGLGGFGGYFQIPPGYREPVLVSGTDGVGTKLKIAKALNRHDTIGIDLVAMCVNDVLTSGAEPLFFLDYLATGKLEPEQLVAVVGGIAAGCVESGCTLLGGETAEMPGFYGRGEYDIAGFCVGIVEKSRLLDGSAVKIGDKVVGIASSGVHSNGFSLVRKILETNGNDWNDRPDLLEGRTLGEVLLTPTRLYVKPVLSMLKKLEIHGMAHITGGGIPENLPRCLGKGRTARVYPDSWPVPPIFRWLAETGEVDGKGMFDTFNMGIGFTLIVPPEAVEDTLKACKENGLNGYTIGEVIGGDGEIVGLY